MFKIKLICTMKRIYDKIFQFFVSKHLKNFEPIAVPITNEQQYSICSLTESLKVQLTLNIKYVLT